jgi:DNA-binding transcriptional regulator YiaG
MSKLHSPAIKKAIAKRIRDYRVKHNISQEELARLLSSSVFSISRWETAKHYPTSSAIKLMKISGVL